MYYYTKLWHVNICKGENKTTEVRRKNGLRTKRFGKFMTVMCLWPCMQCYRLLKLEGKRWALNTASGEGRLKLKCLINGIMAKSGSRAPGQIEENRNTVNTCPTDSGENHAGAIRQKKKMSVHHASLSWLGKRYSCRLYKKSSFVPPIREKFQCVSL